MQVVPQETTIESGEFVVSVSPKGQITMPKAIRTKLGVKPKDKVAIRLEQGEVKVTPVKATFETIYQAVPALKRKLTDKEMAHIAWEDHAQEVAREGV
jgi:AbrB family looped-hinge helix DNA binding protein